MSACIELYRDLSEFRVKELPPTIHYIPEFITKEEEAFLLDHVYKSPKPKWTQLAHRRLQNWGGLPHPKGMAAEKIPEWLEIYMNKIYNFGIFEDKKPNHVLVNEYKAGQGIMPHLDGPLFTPVITTINLGSHAVLDFYHEMKSNDEPEAPRLDNRYFKSILVMPRSLLIIQDEMYHKYLHGIREITEDKITPDVVVTEKNVDECLIRDTRVSLTIRHVPKTLKVQLNLGKWFKKT